ncbi:high-affinity iron permease [Rhodotorula toruloides]|uniref:Iron permease FTR1 family-domain containing protein n=1 Tax=Rhodotorula toruloides TaxID=5286 RepID=A0A2T0A4Z5_RHOTO|nr:Iron permease FTR1 family-domain containing protein [Rhodotorula toruloides]
MGGTIFSVPIFFVVFREVVEAGIVVSILLSLVDGMSSGHQDGAADPEEAEAVRLRVRKRMRWMVWAGALSGLAIAACIGAAFIAVFFTTLSDLWSKSEDLWEGIFCLIACVLIYIMSLGMLRIDRSQIKWKAKFAAAFAPQEGDQKLTAHERKQGRRGKWSLFILPFVTVLRESLEMVVFVGGVSLGQSAKSIPLAAITGLIVGFVIGYLIFASGSRVNLSIFLVVSTSILLLIGAGLCSRGVWFFQQYRLVRGVGGDLGEVGDGPGSFDPTGSVWHLTYGNPENQLAGQGWSIFNALLGWQNTATLGSVLSYVFYWLLVTFSLIYLKWSEGRTSFFGIYSKAGKRRLAKRREGKRDEETVGTESGETKADSGLASIGEKDAVRKEEEGEIVELPGRPVLARGDTSLGSTSSVSSKVEGEEEITEAPRR